MEPRMTLLPLPTPPDYSDDEALVALVDAARVVCHAPASDSDPAVLHVARLDLTVLRLAVAEYDDEN